MCIIIYIIGCILFAVLFINYVFREFQEVTVGNCIITFFASLLSWVGVIIFIIIEYENVVIYKKKEKE